MLYWLFHPLSETWIGFNVFRYITFRAAQATMTALFLSFFVGPWLIARLRPWRVGQRRRRLRLQLGGDR